MTKEEIDMAIDSFFSGAARVSSKKQKASFFTNPDRELSVRIMDQLRESEKLNLKSA